MENITITREEIETLAGQRDAQVAAVENTHMKEHPISSDKRYTVQKEFCGHKEARFVARFAGEWIGQSISYPSAAMLATGHRLIRQGTPVFVNHPAA